MELSDLLCLHRSFGINQNERLRQVINTGQMPSSITCDLAALQADLSWFNGEQRFLLSMADPDYPALLKQIPDPPPLLYCRGNRESLRRPKVAMVGSRSPTHSGIRSARELAAEFVRLGITVVSGLALGIDAASHRGALGAGGVTIAVLGSGCDVIAPRQHETLAAEIASDGLVVSEYPLGTAPYPGNFPRRNRVVTGLSMGTLVVEAALKSGSLVSARLALEQGREVFAVPGSIRSPQSKGCHELLRNGAVLTEAVDDIIPELRCLHDFEVSASVALIDSPQAEVLTETQTKLLRMLSTDPIHIDELCAVMEIEISELMSALLALEIRGEIVAVPGGYVIG